MDRRGARRGDETMKGTKERGKGERRLEEGGGSCFKLVTPWVNREVLGSRLNAIACHLLRSCVYTARPVGSLTPRVGSSLGLPRNHEHQVCLELRAAL